MGIVVDHDKRRRAILKKSLEVFVDEGYEDATFQKIANRCGITRTTLYIYFKNKKSKPFGRFAFLIISVNFSFSFSCLLVLCLSCFLLFLYLSFSLIPF